MCVLGGKGLTEPIEHDAVTHTKITLKEFNIAQTNNNYCKKIKLIKKK